MEIKQVREQFTSTKPRPAMLKDLIRDDFDCADVFFTFRKPSGCITIKHILDLDLDSGSTESTPNFYRSPSKAALLMKSTLHKASEAVINAARHRISFMAVSPRSVSGHGTFLSSMSRRIRWLWMKKKHQCRGQISENIRDKELSGHTSFDDIKADARPIDLSVSKEISTRNSSTNSRTENDFSSKQLQHSSTSSQCSVDNETSECRKSLQNDDGIFSEESLVEKMQRRTVEITYDEDQLSPGSVLDFPANDEQETPPASSFQRKMINVARRAQQLLEKIRQFESLPELDPIDLEKRINLLELELPENGADISDEEQQIQEGEIEREGEIQDERGEPLRAANARRRGCQSETRCEVVYNRMALVEEVEMGGRWTRVNLEEAGDIAFQTETEVWWWLLDDLLLEMCSIRDSAGREPNAALIPAFDLLQKREIELELEA